MSGTNPFKKEYGDDEEMGSDLLDDFFDHLGFKDSAFQNVPAEMHKTKYIGTRQIYDYMRKRVGKVDEKAPPGKATNEKRKVTLAKNESTPPPQ